MATRKTHILSGFVLFLMNTITLENIKFPILPKLRRVAAGLEYPMTTSNLKVSDVVNAFLFVLAIIGCVAILQYVHGIKRDADAREYNARSAEMLKSYEFYKSIEMHRNRFAGGPFSHANFPLTSRSNPETEKALKSGNHFIDAFLNEIRAGNLKAAYGMTSASFRDRVDPEEFEALIRDHSEINEPTQCCVLRRFYLVNRSVHLIASSRNGAKTVVEIEAREGKEWTIDDFKFANNEK